MLGAFSLAHNAFSQQQLKMDFRDAALAFMAKDTCSYTISITKAGFVFDQNLTHYTSIPAVNSSTASGALGLTTIPGYFVPGDTMSQTYSSSHNFVTSQAGEIGCGRYLVTVTSSYAGNPSISFFLDLTDANWPGGYDPILIVLEMAGSSITAFAGVQEHSTPGTYMVENYGYFLPGTLKYWEVRRVLNNQSSVARNRDGFILPSNDYPEVGDATLDVNVEVTGTITVPYNYTFRIDTDPDYYNNGWETVLSFHDNVLFRVYGSLHSDPVWGITTWKNHNVGSYWEGIDLQATQTVSMAQTEVIGAKIGVRASSCTAGNVSLETCLIDSSQASGMFISQSNPTIAWTSIVDNGRHGIENYGNSTNTTFLFGSVSRNGTSGIYADVSSLIDVQHSALVENGLHGIHLNGTGGMGAKARIRGCWIHGHSNGNGIFMERTRNGWVELQSSRIYQNDLGLYLTGPSLLRGWHETLGAGNEWMENDSLGLNCIYSNRVNIGADGSSTFDLARAYYDPGTGEPHYLGRENMIVTPYSRQVELDNGADASLLLNYWGGNHTFTILNGSTLSYNPEISTTWFCNEEAPATDARQLPERIATMMYALHSTFDPNIPIVSQLRNAFKARNAETQLGVAVEASPDSYSLSNAYPNPFRGSTTLRFTIARPEVVSLRVYDILGREVATLASGFYDAGQHSIQFNGASLRSGIYTAVLQGATRTLTTRIILTR